MILAVPYVKWVRDGEKLPLGTEVVQLLARERRPFGTGTGEAEWLLLELRDADEFARTDAALRLLAHDLMESGQEIGELVESMRRTEEIRS